MDGQPVIGVLSTSFGGPYFGALLDGIARALSLAGGRMIAIQTLDAGTYLRDVPEPPGFAHPVAWDHISGFVSLLNAVNREYLQAARAAGKPVVGISHREPGFDYPVLLPDNRTGLQEAITHLVRHGHRRIAFAGNLRQKDIAQRYDTYLETLRALGLEPDPALFYDTEDNQTIGGELVARQMLAAGMPSTAVITGNDANATGLMRALTGAGLTLPADQAVVGFDDLPIAAYLSPSLSTVRQRLGALGFEAVRMVLEELAGRDVEYTDHCVSTRFIARESCGCPGTRTLTDHPDRRLAEITTPEELAAALHEVIGGDEALRPCEVATITGAVDVIAGWLHATAAGLPTHAPRDTDQALIGLKRLHTLSESAVETTRCIRRYGRHLTLRALADGDTAAALRVEDGVQLVIHNLGQITERDRFMESAHFQDTYTSQHEVGMDLLRSHEEDPRTLSWMRRTRAVAARLGLWSTDNDADATGGPGHGETGRWGGGKLEICGVFDLDGDPAGERGATVGVSAFPPRELVAMADLARDLMVFVGPARVNTTDRGMLAVVGPIEARLPTGRETMNQWAALVTIALEHRSVLESLRLQDERLRRAAHYDELTGLVNRTLFLERLTQALADARDTSECHFAVLLLDLDGFKRVNDSLGHIAGDHLLVEAAHRIRGCLRGSSVAARLGGDEFAVLLEDSDTEASSIRVAQRLIHALEAPCVLEGHRVVVSASIGIAQGGPGYQRAEDLIRDADIAMYSAKSGKKGTHAVFDVAMHDHAVRRLRLEAELRHALESGELEAHYQPIIDLNTGVVTAFEALIRWRHPARGLIPPAAFLPLAEESGMLPAIDQWIMREACAQLGIWQSTLPGLHPIRMNVNVSNRQFWDGHLIRDVEKSLNLSNIMPYQLAVEITESVIMHDLTVARATLQALHAIGVGLFIDDFGTGYSSLAALHQLPIDALKIDKSFVAEMTTGTRTRELVRTIVAMGANLGLGLTAEGIETPAQRDDLRAFGCRYGQGYLFGRPEPAAAVERYLSERYGGAEAGPPSPDGYGDDAELSDLYGTGPDTPFAAPTRGS